MTLVLGGAAHLPPAPPAYQFVAVDDPAFAPNPTAEKSGEIGFSGPLNALPMARGKQQIGIAYIEL